MARKIHFPILLILGLATFHFVTSDFSQFKQEVLEQHNVLRARHGSPPLALSFDLSHEAQEKAETVLGQFKRVRHFYTSTHQNEEDSDFIDHIWGSVECKDSNLTAKEVLEEWLGEENLYNWTRNYYEDETGHFTQMVWKDTSDLGIGVATVRDSRYRGTVVVLRYAPAGNILDEASFAQNVLPEIK